MMEVCTQKHNSSKSTAVRRKTRICNTCSYIFVGILTIFPQCHLYVDSFSSKLTQPSQSAAQLNSSAASDLKKQDVTFSTCFMILW